MYIKMKELCSLSNESKSTILYYIKEGLLPEPKKPKANLHLYEKSIVDLIKFIKFLQKKFNFSISQIKTIFQETKLNKGYSFEKLVNALELAAVFEKKLLSKEEFLKECNITHQELEYFIKKGYLYPKEGKFGQKELEIVKLLKEANNLQIDKLLDKYVKSARKIAAKEIDFWQQIFDNPSHDTIKEYQLLFSIMLELKPYIYNMQSILAYKKEKENERAS